MTKVGKVIFSTYVEGKIHEITLSGVYYAPSLSRDPRLISYGQLKKLNCKFVDADDGSGTIVKNGQVVFQFQMVNDVCMIDTVRNEVQQMKKELLTDVVV